MILYALAAVGLACNAMMFARVGVVGATVFGSLAAGLHLTEKSPVPAAGMTAERAARAEMPGAGGRPVRKVQRLTEELSYYLDRERIADGGRLGPLRVGSA